jgi:hypothetical protein
VEVGLLNKRVSLYESRRDDMNPIGDPLIPRDVWAQIDNQGITEARTFTHLMTIRYHPQVTIDTVAVYKNRNLFVRSVQNVGEDNVEMRLLCEEIAL